MAALGTGFSAAASLQPRESPGTAGTASTGTGTASARGSMESVPGAALVPQWEETTPAISDWLITPDGGCGVAGGWVGVACWVGGGLARYQ